MDRRDESHAFIPMRKVRSSASRSCGGLLFPNLVREEWRVTRGPIKPMALHSFHPVKYAKDAKDDLLQGRVNRIWHHVVRYADCIDDLGDLEISRPSGNGFFQPDGSDESLCAFLGLLGFHHCAVRSGFRTACIFREEMNPSARLR
jgi:hypothetical protein